MTKKPFEDTAGTQFLRDRLRDLAHRKSQTEIAAEAGFVNPNMLSILKAGKSKLPLDRIPAIARALECDPALLMRLALDQAVGKTAAMAIVEIFGSPVTANEHGWLEEIRDASNNTDPRITARSRATLRGIFVK